MAARAGGAAVLAGAALLLAACAAAPAPTHSATTPTASPTPTLSASACTWSGVREQVDDDTLGHFAVALTNTSTGTCLLDGYPTAVLTGGPRGTESVGQATAKGLPEGPVVVPAGATAYAPMILATTTDGGITGHCRDSRHTTLQLTPAGSPSTISVDVTLLHPCAPQPGFGWAVYPIQAAMPTGASFSG